jgi:possible conjugal transfer protein trbG
MSEKVRATELPVLFIKDEQTGEGASVRYRYDPETRYYTVDRLFKQATLRYGNKEIIIKRKGSFIKSPNDHISVSI